MTTALTFDEVSAVVTDPAALSGIAAKRGGIFSTARAFIDMTSTPMQVAQINLEKLGSVR
jgi:hypothetical protein